MPLIYSVPNAGHHAERLVVMDTSALIDLAKRPDWTTDIDTIRRAYTLVIPTPVMYELCFGSPERVDAQQAILKGWINKSGSDFEMRSFGISFKQGKIASPGGIYVVNPNSGE